MNNGIDSKPKLAPIILTHMQNYMLRTGKRPTHLYMDSDIFAGLVEQYGEFLGPGVFLGMKWVICDPIPENANSGMGGKLFVTA